MRSGPKTLVLAGLAVAAVALPLVTAGASASPAVPAHAAQPRLQFLGEHELANGLQFDGTTVGGLSAISYDRRSGQYYVISDDRSAIDPARFYTAKLAFSKNSFDGVELTGTRPWLRPDGTPFPKTSVVAGQMPTIAPDPEGIAINPKTGSLFWSSEGERIVPTDAPAALGDPWVREAGTDGTFRRELALPPQLHMNSQAVGPRQNQTLEGLSFTPDGRQLFSAMEDPLYQDGADPTASAGGLTRVNQYDVKSGRPVAQFAYPLSPFFTTIPASDPTATNGVSEILALGDGRFLVVERAVVFSTQNWKVRVYLAQARHATNVLDRDTLDADVRPMTKRLLVDLSDVPGLDRVDNIEGITLGPKLADGRQSLVLVSDNNFNSLEITQFIAFAASGL
jgi:3-phytase